MVTVCFCFSQQWRGPEYLRWRTQRAREESRVSGISGTQSFECIVLCAFVFVKPSCPDFSDKQRIQTLNHRTQRNPS